MIDGKSVLCILPVRGGSKGVRDKNLRPLGGRPLVDHTLEQMRSCELIDRAIVSTDSEALAERARLAGVEVPFVRPAELAGDRVGTIEVLLHAMDFLESTEGVAYDLVVLLHATAPFRSVDDIAECLRLVALEGAENAFSVSVAERNPYFNMVETDASGRVALSKQGSFSSRQDAPEVYQLNSAVYVWPWQVLRDRRSVVLPGSKLHVMPRERSVDIDDELDFRIAECLLSNASLPSRPASSESGL